MWNMWEIGPKALRGKDLGAFGRVEDVEYVEGVEDVEWGHTDRGPLTGRAGVSPWGTST
jgi:hypothetical protein